MKKKYIAIIVALGILVLLGATCPDKQAHQDEIKTAFSDYVDSELAENASEDEQGWAVLGSMFANKLIEVFLDSKLKVNNYIIFSTGEIHYQGKSKTLSFGFLNHVFTYGVDDIRNAVKEAGSDMD